MLLRGPRRADGASHSPTKPISREVAPELSNKTLTLRPPSPLPPFGPPPPLPPLRSSQRLGLAPDKHLPGHTYTAHEAVHITVNKVGPFNNPHETYRYYSLPFCSTHESLSPESQVSPGGQKHKQVRGWVAEGEERMARSEVTMLHEQSSFATSEGERSDDTAA